MTLYEWLTKSVAFSESRECILWKNSTDGRGGYGKVWDPTLQKMVFAHRVVCEAAHGAPPTPAHEAAHGCNTRLCVNPAHLRWATKLENMGDRDYESTKLVGVEIGTSVLTETQVREIRAAPRGYGTGYLLAEQYGVSDATISSIRHNKGWRHV